MTGPRATPQAGTSLLEALVALACLGVGAVALARQHTALHHSAEASRQQAQALRLAQSTLEAARTGARLASLRADQAAASPAPPAGASGGAPALAGSACPPGTMASTAGCEIGTSCAVETAWQPSAASSLAPHAVQVTVSWRDRSGAPQRLALASILGGAPPPAPPRAPPPAPPSPAPTGPP